jgi:hypothetical protein
MKKKPTAITTTIVAIINRTDRKSQKENFILNLPYNVSISRIEWKSSWIGSPRIGF